MSHRLVNERGYTLIELTLVILIIGILIAGVAIPLASQVGLAKQKQAREELARIEEALIGYAVADPNHRLPCPDTDGDGVQNFGSAPDYCDDGDNPEGYLPWRELGVGRLDPWGNPYRYRGNNAFTNQFGVPAPGAATSGTLQVYDTSSTPKLLTSGNPNAPAAIVFSCGPNGTADQDNASNAGPGCVNDTEPVNDNYTQDIQDETLPFDDILVILSKHVLVNRLVQSGQWP
jgi:prepilin-type N-terminal cleavage/methylation domain-containing protein